ncbi:hypothetical protein HY250_04405 [Candidatus Azambacteria bacterium]|nr:hypothetical protein [Candidatus Azambacteria bacterium]
MLVKIIFFLHRCVRALGNRMLDKQLIYPRFFSNALLRRYAPLFKGSVLNISGWDDRDQESGFYRSYFTHHSAYAVSNARTEKKGFGSMAGSDIREIELDLEKPLPDALKKKFDAVFNHTTLEHVFDVQTAFKNICELSRDAVIIVVPVIQQIHIAPSYGDYWRITTMGIAQLFLQNGFTPLVMKTNDQPFNPVYCFAIGVRDPVKYSGTIKEHMDFEMGAALYGSGLKSVDIQALLKRRNNTDEF